MYKYLRLALLVLAISVSFGQSVTASKALSVPVIEDRDLYSAFFQYHQSLVNLLQAAVNANPQASVQLNQQMATLLGVDLADLPTIIAKTTWFTQQNAAVAAQQTNTPSTPAGGLTPSQLSASVDFTQVRITAETVRLMYQNISATSWAGLHAYITGTYKNTIYKH